MSVCSLISATGVQYKTFVLFKRISNEWNALPPEQSAQIEKLGNIVARGSKSGVISQGLFKYWLEYVFVPEALQAIYN